MNDFTHPLVGPDQETIRIVNDRRSLLMRCRDARVELPLRAEQFSAACGVCLVFESANGSNVQVYENARGWYTVQWRSELATLGAPEASKVTHHNLEAAIEAAATLGLVVRCP